MDISLANNRALFTEKNKVQFGNKKSGTGTMEQDLITVLGRI